MNSLKKLPPKPVRVTTVTQPKSPVVARKGDVASTKKVANLPAIGNFSSYAGISKPVNSSRSKTEIDISGFGKYPNGNFTDRDYAFAVDLKATFGGKAFQRGALDAGSIKRLGERGYLSYVSGELSTSFCVFKLTNKALSLGKPAKHSA